MTDERQRFDGWAWAILAYVVMVTLLVVATVRQWPVPWWIYVAAFSLCLLMPLWAAWRYWHVWRQ